MTNEEKLDQALNQERQRQERDLVIDFDQAVEAQKDKAIKIKYKGKTYTVPGETPQWYMNIILRKLHESRRLDFSSMTEEQIIESLEVSDNEHDDVFRRLFGDEFVNSYLNDNMVSKAMLTDKLLNPILEKWGWMPVQDTSEKKTNLDK